MEPDGNLVMYAGTPAKPTLPELWSTGTSGQCSSGVCEAIFQTDGNLVLYDDGYPYWSSGTAGKGGILRLQTSAPFVSILDALGKTTVWQRQQ